MPSTRKHEAQLTHLHLLVCAYSLAVMFVIIIIFGLWRRFVAATIKTFFQCAIIASAISGQMCRVASALATRRQQITLHNGADCGWLVNSRIVFIVTIRKQIAVKNHTLNKNSSRSGWAVVSFLLGRLWARSCIH